MLILLVQSNYDLFRLVMDTTDNMLVNRILGVNDNHRHRDFDRQRLELDFQEAQSQAEHRFRFSTKMPHPEDLSAPAFLHLLSWPSPPLVSATHEHSAKPCSLHAYDDTNEAGGQVNRLKWPLGNFQMLGCGSECQPHRATMTRTATEEEVLQSLNSWNSDSDESGLWKDESTIGKILTRYQD